MKPWAARAWAVIALLAMPGCRLFAGDPREVLVKLNVPYTTDAWLDQSAAGDTVAIKAFLAAGIAYGRVVGTVKSSADVLGMITKS